MIAAAKRSSFLASSGSRWKLERCFAMDLEWNILKLRKERKQARDGVISPYGAYDPERRALILPVSSKQIC
jgi:hypothetical protein